MSFSDKEKRRLIALTRALKQEKGLSMKKVELDSDIARFRDAQKQLEVIKQEYKDSPAVIKEAEKESAKLQAIVEQLNEYMSIIHPEGLLDIGNNDGKGKSMMVSG